MVFRRMIVLIVLLSSVIGIYAQDTATPAPSKTPEAVVVTEEATEDIAATEEVASDSTDTTLVRAFTQEDLRVLVGNVQRPNGIIWFEDDLYTACNGDWTLYAIDSVTGSTITFVYGVQNSHTLYAEDTDAGFDLWIPDFDLDKLVRVGHQRTSPATVTSENMNGPWGITPFDDEQFLITNIRANNIVRVGKDGNTQIVMDGLRSPAGIVLVDDYVYVANNGSARRAIEWFPVDTLPTSEDADPVTGVAQPLVSGLQNASNLVLADDGYLYFTFALGTRGVVGRVNPDDCRDEGCANDQVEIVLFTELQAPLAGLTISSDMRLFVHTIFRPEIYWVSLYD